MDFYRILSFILIILSLDTLKAQDVWQSHYNKARENYKTDIDIAISEAMLSKDIAFEMKDVELIGKSHWMIGWLYTLKGDALKSFTYYLGARKAYLRLRDWEKLEQIEENLGSIAYENGSFGTAIKRWEDRLETANKLGNKKRIAEAHFDLGLAYKRDGEYAKSFDHFFQARAIYMLYYEKRDSTALARVFNELGILYKNTFKRGENWVMDSSLINYDRALDMDKSYLMQAMISNNKGNIYRVAGNYPKAVIQYKLALKFDSLIENERLTMSHLTNLGHTYYLMEKPDSSIAYLTRAINMEYGDVSGNYFDLNNMIELDMSEFLLRAVQLIDSIRSIYPRYVTNIDYTKVLESATRIKMNVSLIDKKNSIDMIELANNEMESELKEELFWSRLKLWGFVISTALLFAFLTYKLIRWYMVKRAVQREYDKSRQEAERLIKEI